MLKKIVCLISIVFVFISCKQDIDVINQSAIDSLCTKLKTFSTSYIIRTDKTLWACGSNDWGQFGNGNYISGLNFIKIADSVIQVSGGYNHTFIIKEDNTLWVTGNNLNGELGIDDSVNVKINIFTKATDSVKSISCSNDFSFILSIFQ